MSCRYYKRRLEHELEGAEGSRQEIAIAPRRYSLSDGCILYYSVCSIDDFVFSHRARWCKMTQCSATGGELPMMIILSHRLQLYFPILKHQ